MKINLKNIKYKKNIFKEFSKEKEKDMFKIYYSLFYMFDNMRLS